MTVAFFLTCALLLLLATQVIGSQAYLRWFRSYPISDMPDSQLPPAAVVLSLRGADESLTQCLDGIANLNYPNYEIHIVLDHEQDPAKEIVSRWAKENDHFPLKVSVLSEISRNAYLKTSAIRQCLRRLAPTLEAAVMVDADTIVYPNWLRDIVIPMVNSDVGLVTGNRWYVPQNTSLGSRVRFIYNAWSVPAMYFMQATWGGSLAIRRDAFDQPYFYDRMLDTSSEESAMQEATRHAGLRMSVHPNVMMLQRDPIALEDCFRFIRRQLIWTRLYHPQWLNVVIGVLAIYLLTAASVLWGLFCAWAGDWRASCLIFTAVASLAIGNLLVINHLHHRIIGRIKSVQRVHTPEMDWRTGLRILVALPAALGIFVAAVVSATIARHVAWRGILYRLKPPRQLEMLEYRPFAPTASYRVPLATQLDTESSRKAA